MIPGDVSNISKNLQGILWIAVEIVFPGTCYLQNKFIAAQTFYFSVVLSTLKKDHNKTELNSCKDVACKCFTFLNLKRHNNILLFRMQWQFIFRKLSIYLYFFYCLQTQRGYTFSNVGLSHYIGGAWNLFYF